MQHSGGLPVTHVPIKRLQNINTHRQLIHEAKKYPCDHQASSIGNITTHKQLIHEGKTYPCDNCDYQATTRESLTAHKHLNIRQKGKER